MRRPRQIVLVAALGIVAMSGACRREERRFQEPRERTLLTQTATLSALQPGERVRSAGIANPYAGNAWAIAEGKRLFEWYNCTGCHHHGGGGIGPPLMDDRWIYGGTSHHIVRTIAEGRPNGMPAFAQKMPDYQLWQIAAYVQSMGGNVALDVAPGRNDSISLGTPEAMRSEEPQRPEPAVHR